MNKHKCNINNLDCANCAREIEEELNKNEKLKNVVVNFSTSKISYESKYDISLKEINNLVKKVEPDVSITPIEEIKHNKEYPVYIFIAGILFGILGLFINLPFYFNELLIIISYIIFLYRPSINAFKTLIKNKTINENALIAISCIGAYLIGEITEGLAVVSLYILGKLLEEKAINNTRKSINDLINIKQDYANKKINNELIKIDVYDILVNDILVVKKGEKIPVDGIVVKGNTTLDTSALTGESELIEVKIKTKVLSGSINTGDVITIQATNLYKDSTVSKILDLVEEATDKKAKTETFISKFSKIYTPIVIVLAFLITILFPLFTDLSLNESIYRGLTFLVISCPCAIAISVPLSYFAGIGISSKNGILIKGSNYLDSLSNLNKIVFDKTGTLTTGTFEVTNIKSFDDKYSVDDIVDILVKGESLSNHPIAHSIMKLTDKKVNSKDVKNYKEIEGVGISFSLNKQNIKIGNIKKCKYNEDMVIHLHIDDKHIASITINDGIKREAFETIKQFKKLKIKTFMFTGDKKDVALEIGKKLGINEIKYEMLPTDKYYEYERIDKGNTKVAFVGDGINDAPVLKRADIGISMGKIGSASAIEASDIVIMTDDLTKIPKAIEISKYTKNIIIQNIVFALSIKVIVLLLSVLGYATIWFAVFADTGVTLLTILNTLRIMKKYNI